MTGKKPNTKPDWTDPDDAPEWSDDVVERAAHYRGERLLEPARGTLVRAGRPRLANPKRQVTLRLDHDLVDQLRASGSGWQSRVNQILRKAICP